jgi:hypothetical protein
MRTHIFPLDGASLTFRGIRQLFVELLLHKDSRPWAKKFYCRSHLKYSHGSNTGLISDKKLKIMNIAMPPAGIVFALGFIKIDQTVQNIFGWYLHTEVMTT